ncbi:Hypothetical predicted protein [Mytilus galloprovincialis]|uniref:Helix-turn-helix domain-containing protein n=1 Tax=Mytilus galloprovincialis TaxID=29158 RepID=A0A8B6BQ70_MYTGA|nr:Hypothetical predicted protein [Mytilus galloprovincialis]
MHRKGVMDEITFKYLSAKRDLKPGRLYLLPKLHKLDPELIESVQQNPTLYKNVRIQGRPIVSLSGTVLERIGQYLDKFMLPAVVKQETHLRDSLEFINIIEKLQKISSLYRFRDDGFFIYNEGTDDEIAQFFEHANRQHALLKFTHEKSQTKMQFLDVLVFKGPRFRETGILDLTTFRKKTENYQYLERSSCHPSSTFRGIIKGEMLRFKRCTNDPVDLQTQYALFSERLIKRGYPKNEIKTVMQEVTAKQRKDTLMVKPKSVLMSPPLVFSTVFSRQKSHIKTNILKHWDQLKDDEEAKLLFDKRPLFAFRRH